MLCCYGCGAAGQCQALLIACGCVMVNTAQVKEVWGNQHEWFILLQETFQAKKKSDEANIIHNQDCDCKKIYAAAKLGASSDQLFFILAVFPKSFWYFSIFSYLAYGNTMKNVVKLWELHTNIFYLDPLLVNPRDYLLSVWSEFYYLSLVCALPTPNNTAGQSHALTPQASRTVSP